MTRTYTVTKKRKLSDNKKKDWNVRLSILTMVKKEKIKNLSEVARRIGLSRQRISVIYQEIENMSIKKIQSIIDSLE